MCLGFILRGLRQSMTQIKLNGVFLIYSITNSDRFRQLIKISAQIS
jgi:hypothetical protein